ncbi:hypothetical protein HMPREF0731_2612, partial [Pseudoroseomonas cervicalis ATCC 49957]
RQGAIRVGHQRAQALQRGELGAALAARQGALVDRPAAQRLGRGAEEALAADSHQAQPGGEGGHGGPGLGRGAILEMLAAEGHRPLADHHLPLPVLARSHPRGHRLLLGLWH